jgi:hypothetical protein
MMVMQPLPVSSARVDAMPKVPLEKASNSNTPEEGREVEIGGRRGKEESEQRGRITGRKRKEEG